MSEQDKQVAVQRKQLRINVVLALFTFFTLVATIVAWFTTNTSAKIDAIRFQVSSREISVVSPVTSIVFPCATKIGDDQTTPMLFNSECAQTRLYELDAEGNKVIAAPQMTDGLLAYVCDTAVGDDGDLYAEVYQKLTNVFGTADLSDKSYEELREALLHINKRAVGELSGDYTKMRILYWVEYDAALADGQTLNEAAYTNIPYTIRVVFANSGVPVGGGE